MFDNPTALTAVTVANLIGIASGVMRKYASDQTSVPPSITEMEREVGIEPLIAAKLQASLAYLG
jgi:hypothetical protein